LVLAALVPASTAVAQWNTRAEGADICRPIWREYGRSMHGHADAVYCEVRDVGTLAVKGPIAVDGGEKNGVLVRGARRSDALVRLVIQAQGKSVDDARKLAKGVSLDLTRSPLQVTGTTQRGDEDDDHFVAASIVIEAPEQIDLSLHVNYAPLEVEKVRGKMDLQAEYGPLTMRDVGGDVRARVEHGPITVDLSAPRWQGTALDAEAAYGPVLLRVPRDFGAELEIGAAHGPLDIDFPLTLTRLDGSLIETRLGAGGPRVRAVARYGPMSLKVNRDASR
jgi:hypothetical protein